MCFSSIKATSQKVIAVGTSGNGNDLTDGRLLIERWDGEQWKIVSYFTHARGTFTVGGAAIFDQKNIWAIQQDPHSWGLTIEHWDGTTWLPTKTPVAPSGHVYSFQAIDALNTRFAWVVGQDMTFSADNVQSAPLAASWDGKQWQQVNIQGIVRGSGISGLVSVKMFS